MKKLGMATIAMMTLLSASLAQADGCWHHDCGDDGAGNFLAILATLYTTSTVGVNADDRAVYIQGVREDAANYIAGGQETAVLQNAIQNLRADAHVTGSDKDIAEQLVSSMN